MGVQVWKILSVLGKKGSAFETLVKNTSENCHPYQQATYFQARDMCCALGTRLVALKTEAKRKCLTKLSKGSLSKSKLATICDEMRTSCV